eukprot:1682271-Pleurochrysis_carterae.AAC.1
MRSVDPRQRARDPPTPAVEVGPPSPARLVLAQPWRPMQHSRAPALADANRTAAANLISELSSSSIT